MLGSLGTIVRLPDCVSVNTASGHHCLPSSSGVALLQGATSYVNTQRYVTLWFKQEPLVDYLRPRRVYSWSAPKEFVIGQLSIGIFCLDFGEWLRRREETRMAQAAADAFRERLSHGSGGTDYQPRPGESRLCPYAHRLEQDRTGQRLTTYRRQMIIEK